jgi:hypothetical protein
MTRHLFYICSYVWSRVKLYLTNTSWSRVIYLETRAVDMVFLDLILTIKTCSGQYLLSFQTSCQHRDCNSLDPFSMYLVGNFGDVPHNLLYSLSDRVFVFPMESTMYPKVQVRMNWTCIWTPDYMVRLWRKAKTLPERRVKKIVWGTMLELSTKYI